MFTIKTKILDKLKCIKGKIKEYIKFNIVGTINFIVAQGFYLTLYLKLQLNYVVAYTITSIISVTASYYFNSKFTFKNSTYSFRKYLLSILVYIFEYIFNMCIILSLVNVFNINKAFAPMVAPIFSTIPVFLLMRIVINKTDNKK